MANKKLKYPTGGMKNQSSKGVGGKSNPNPSAVFEHQKGSKQYGGPVSTKISKMIHSKMEMP